MHLEIALEVHEQVLTRQSPDCLRPFWIPAKPAVDNLDVHLDVHLETVPEVHEQVLTQQSPDCLVTPAEPAIKKEPAEPAAKYTQESNWTSCRTPAEPAITEEPTEPVAKYT